MQAPNLQPNLFAVRGASGAQCSGHPGPQSDDARLPQIPDAGSAGASSKRRGDPDTSKAAAVKAERFDQSQSAKIMWAMSCLQNCTALSIASATGLTVVQVDRRLPELRQQDKIKRVLLPNGKFQSIGGFTVWELAKWKK
jgi:hypothetical protein